MQAQARGLMALLGAVALFSTVEVVAKLIGGRVAPWQQVFLRFFVTGLVLLVLIGRQLPMRLRTLHPVDYGIFLLNGFLSITVALSLFHLALLYGKAASCAVIFSANPIFVVIMARFINQEKWHWSKLAAVVCGTAGVALFAWDAGGINRQSLLALLLMSAAALFFAAGICVSRRVIARYGVFLLMGFTGLFGSMLLLPLALWSWRHAGIGGLLAAWPLMLYLVLAGTTLAYALYYFGLRYCSAFQASMTFFLKPVLASLLAALILREHINLPMIAGSALVLTGLMFTVVFRARAG